MKSSDFRTITTSPLNGAPLPSALVKAEITGAGEFFVRNHGEIVDETANGKRQTANWCVSIAGMVHTPLALTLPLSPSPRTSVESTLQCAGNRRTALQKIRPIPNEVPWPNEAISNATWDGVSLAAVLEQAGVQEGAAHVWFTGGEPLIGKHAGESFGASIPLAKALDGSVLIADTMNGAPLPAEHGAPVRMIVPGYIGARSVKWVTEIRVEREPSPNYFQRAYSVFPPDIMSIPAGNMGGTVLGEMVLNSAFGSPADGAQVAAGRVTMRGWALAGGNRQVERVEVSLDAGATWLLARFISPPKPFVWRLWEADVSLTPGTHELVCRAFDDTGGAQPPDAVWNVKGYMNNCWDRVSVLAA